MIRAASALALKSYATSIGLHAVGRVSTPSFTSALARLGYTRSISYSASLHNQYERSPMGASAEDKLELRSASQAPKDFSRSKSLHVSRIDQETTDEEFRQAFSGLKGLVNAELSGFGFLHFENESAAAAAAQHLEEFPVRIRGYATDINPYTSRSLTSTEPSHTIHISGVPLDLQYLEVVELLREKASNQKSIRFMTNRDQGFLGVISIAFNDTESAVDAKKYLIGASLGGVELREHNVQYGRPLWDEKPTTTLIITGIPREPREANKFYLANLLHS
ncbi:hypothetical protein FRC10_004313 [Ceratobasidium sp. 414]|nr:hypothetical protein FRC10_004313 [Ceratobasidium sp. 414]